MELGRRLSGHRVRIRLASIAQHRCDSIDQAPRSSDRRPASSGTGTRRPVVDRVADAPASSGRCSAAAAPRRPATSRWAELVRGDVGRHAACPRPKLTLGSIASILTLLPPRRDSPEGAFRCTGSPGMVDAIVNRPAFALQTIAIYHPVVVVAASMRHRGEADRAAAGRCGVQNAAIASRRRAARLARVAGVRRRRRSARLRRCWRRTSVSAPTASASSATASRYIVGRGLLRILLGRYLGLRA